MLLPLMGLVMFFIPMAGFLAGMVFLFSKHLRFLAVFACLMPLIGAYAAVASFFGTALGLEHLGLSERTSGIGALLGFALGGLIGTSAGFILARGIRRAFNQARQ